MENRKIEVISTVDAIIGIEEPQLRFSRTWDRQGTVRVIDFDTLRELSYNTGVWNMFQRGMLYIKDMEAKIELGLESEDAKEPTNIVVLDEKQKLRYLKNAPIFELQEICKKLTLNEINNLVDYAIENEIIDYDKSNYLKSLTNRDIIKTIELRRAEKND